MTDSEDSLYALLADKLSADAHRDVLAQLVWALRESGGDGVKKAVRTLAQQIATGVDDDAQD